MSPRAIPEALRAPITNIEQGRAWVKLLCDSDLNFHLEDGAAEIIDFQTDKPIFTKKDARIVQARVDELYKLEPSLWAPHECPIGYMIEVLRESGKWPVDED